MAGVVRPQEADHRITAAVLADDHHAVSDTGDRGHDLLDGRDVTGLDPPGHQAAVGFGPGDHGRAKPVHRDPGPIGDDRAERHRAAQRAVLE
jgi:hypothetical protein